MVQLPPDPFTASLQPLIAAEPQIPGHLGQGRPLLATIPTRLRCYHDVSRLPSLRLPRCVARGGRLATGRSPWLLTTGTTSFFTDFYTCLMLTVMRGIYVLLLVRTRRTCAGRIDIVSFVASVPVP